MTYFHQNVPKRPYVLQTILIQHLEILKKKSAENAKKNPAFPPATPSHWTGPCGLPATGTAGPPQVQRAAAGAPHEEDAVALVGGAAQGAVVAARERLREALPAIPLRSTLGLLGLIAAGAVTHYAEF